ncbi:TonB-dependent receptor [Sphingomonas sp. 37zxx]|uniref:TonB-dependent receptor n=1 Tax=Sphingomonas sp. 37zxx TaxID=1550073 RepID=UPI0009DCD05A|nr:TonB-dependent receptor [Sphingomonas sp. 37zxx]
MVFRHGGALPGFTLSLLLSTSFIGLAAAAPNDKEPVPEATPEAALEWLPASLPESLPEFLPQTRDTSDEKQIAEIIVTGSRASQQSANQRKKNAKTATDSLVADDIGSFPDRNVNEAISRLPGVALDRNDFGEGASVAIRGNGPDLTRVELDGIGVQGSSGLGASRGADLRELPAELIKSVDVVKGSTADMTEGSLGGGVQIKTRSGLDFAKPYFTLRSGAQMNSIGKTWTPDVSGVAAGKFFDNRIGVIVSGSYTDIQNIGHTAENTTSSNRGYSRLFDFDQSPEKTFTFNPATLSGDLTDIVFANSLETPRSLVTKSAGAQSKADCIALFPHNPAGTNLQRSQRILEQQSCLNQWNDYTPSLVRNIMKTQRDKRYAFDARLDFRVTDEFLVYTKGTVANRKVDDQFRTRSPLSLFLQNPIGSFVDTATGYPRVRSLSPNALPGFAVFDQQYGLSNVANNATLGNVLNVVPGSVTVDDKHNVTKMTLTNNAVNIDQIENTIDVKTNYYQTGAEFRGALVDIDAMIGLTTTSSSRTDFRTARSYSYGDATLELQSNGLWDIQLPANYDDSNPANFVQLTAPRCIGAGTAPTCLGQAAVVASANAPATPAYTVGQMPLTTPNFGLTFRPTLSESQERIGKLDVTYRTDEVMPFITRVKYGAMYRNNTIDFWGGGGYTPQGAVGTFGQPGYVAPVVVPTANVTGQLRACQPTPGSQAAGGLSCNYGFVPSTNPSNIRSGVDTLTPQQLLDLFSNTIERPDSQYFGSLPNRGNLPSSWNGILTDRLFQAVGAGQFANFDCLKQCVGSDGQTYDQPVTRTDETIVNLYGMFDFAQRLPFGLEVDGNVGLRGIYANVSGSGLLTLNVIRTTASFDPLNPNVAAGITSQSFAQNTTAKATTWDWLPSGNINLWAFDRSLVFRAYVGKTVARPTPNQLLAAGNCNIDERVILDLDGDGDDPFGCPGRIGNPALAPFTAWNQNYSLEWYPNADTVLSATYGKLDVKMGGGIGVTRTGRPFSGSDQIDPLTGQPISELDFNYPTFENGPGYQRDIWEFSAKSAFTFLPWFLRYTGADANVSLLSSSTNTGTQDPSTGDIMPPLNESRYFINSSIWYDDGKLNVRIAYQKRSEIFRCITPCGGNTGDINYPGVNWTNVRLVGPGYNPGLPLFKDATQFIDVKVSYNITRALQVYAEGRNMTGEAQTLSTGEYQTFADDTPRLTQMAYGGRRFLLGGRLLLGQGGTRR